MFQRTRTRRRSRTPPQYEQLELCVAPKSGPEGLARPAGLVDSRQHRRMLGRRHPDKACVASRCSRFSAGRMIRSHSKTAGMRPKAGLLILALLLGVGCVAQRGPLPPSGARLDPRAAVQTVDLGRLRVGDAVEYIFLIENSLDTPLELRLARASCECGINLLDGGVVPARKTARVRLALEDPLASGPLRLAAAVATSDPARPRLVLELRADVVPDISVSPDILWLADASRGSSTTGRAAIGFAVEGVAIEAVEVVDGNFEAIFEAAPEAGSGGTLVVRHAGRPDSGLYEGLIVLRTTSSRQPKIKVPVLVRFR